MSVPIPLRRDFSASRLHQHYREPDGRKAYTHLPVLRAALLRHQQAVLANQADQRVARKSLAA